MTEETKLLPPITQTRLDRIEELEDSLFNGTLSEEDWKELASLIVDLPYD